MSRKTYLYAVRLVVHELRGVGSDMSGRVDYPTVLVEAPSQARATYLAVASKLVGNDHPQSLGTRRITRPEWRDLAANGAEEL